MSLADFEILKPLGEGAYSTVFKARRRSDGNIYALKKVAMAKLKQKEKLNALNEVRILASIKHPNVISYKEAFFDEPTNTLCIVMEYADGGDLYQRVLTYQKKGTYMSEAFLWSCAVQAVRGLKALHDLHILHRDLKSANVFLTSNGEVKIGDMNVSKVAKQGMLHTQTGTPYYASPEVWRDVPYDAKSDIWSLGCVLYEAACLKPPFRAEDMQGLYKKVTRGEYPQLPKNFSKELHQFVSYLLRVDPRSRPTCADLLRTSALVKRLPRDDEQSTSRLLNTIRFSNNSTLLTDSLPQAAYLECEELQLEPNTSLHRISPVRQYRAEEAYRRDRSQQFKVAPQRRREVSESPSVQRRMQKQILKDQYGALRLPRIKYPKQSVSEQLYGSRKHVQAPKSLKPKLAYRPSVQQSLLI